MNKLKTKYLLVIASVFLLVSILSSCKQKKPDELSLVVVETSDVHGAIFNADFINGGNPSGSMSKVHNYITKLKDSANVILMDNGDILQGQPTVYYYNYQNTEEEHLVSKVMNYMQYDVATIGNHDIEAGHNVYDKLKQDFKFPWLAANAIDLKTGEPYFEPYTVINKKGIKIAIFGLITPGIPKWLPEELWSGIEFEDMVVSARKWVPIIMEKENPDLLIGLFHAGYDYTYGNANYDTPKNENGSRLVAEQVPGFDIVFVGHDHRTWNEKIKNTQGEEVLILGPTSSARQVAKAEVKMTLNEEGQYAKDIKGEIVEMANVKPDSSFNDVFKKEFKQVKDYVSKQVGIFEKSIDGHEALYGPSVFVDLIHKIQLDISGADISFAAPLSYRSFIEKGPVYVSDMFKLYRFENFLYTMSLTGKEIDDYLEYSFSGWFNTMTDPNDHLLKFKKDEEGNLILSERYNTLMLESQFYNFDAAAGIDYTIDLREPDYDKVTINSLSNGDIFYPDSIYIVAINSYRGNGGGGHLTEGVGLDKEELKTRKLSSTEKDLRYYMMQWIQEKETINPTALNNWKIIPNDWWEEAKKRDYKLLNNNE